MNEELLSLRGIKKAFTGTGEPIELFRNLALDLRPGDFVAITGASGVGKSTLLHIIGLLEQPSEGTVLFRGEDVSHFSDTRLSKVRSRDIGFVFQFHHLLPDLTVWENVLLPARIARQASKAVEEKASDLIERVGMAHRLRHFPSQLSGGERQRVALARALLNGPSVLLCDEPSGNLDDRNSEQLHQLLLDLNSLFKLAILVVTHDMHLARLASNRFELHDGVLVDEGMGGSHAR
jgi:lipoprotein-releasing system ATP-binding protein